MITSKQELVDYKEKFVEFIKETARIKFDHLVNEGWITLTDKKPQEISGAIVSNFKNGKEFGDIFGRSVEIKIDDWLKKLE